MSSLLRFIYLAVDSPSLSIFTTSIQLFLRLLRSRVTLRILIMPLGASITEGNPSPPDDSSGNGYRMFLRDKLRSEGWKVNMVGNRRRGTMNDNVRGDNKPAIES